MNRWILCGCAFSLLLGGCTNKAKNYRPTSQEIRLNLHSEPPTLDPRKATDNVSVSVLNLCFEGLTRRNLSGEVIPAVAERIVVSEDQKRYTFFLRESTWADGKPVTAYDFEATWKTMLSPSFPCEFASDLYVIQNARAAKSGLCPLDAIGVKALDSKTLQVDLEHPAAYFLAALASHAFFPTPSHLVSAYPNWIEEHYIGNGPFVLQEWKHLDQMVLQKNQNYWDQSNTRLEKVIFTLVEDEATELSMYENGELDWAGYPLSNLPAEAVPSLEKKGALHSFDISGTYFYVFNTKEFPFTNVNIRRALSLAINRAAITSNVTQLRQQPAMSLIPPTMWKEGAPCFKDHDLIEAKKCFEQGLKELGIQELPPIHLSYNTNVGHHKIAQAIQEQWHQAFGIRVELENKEWKVFLDELKHHKFQVARMGSLASINDPSTFLDYYRYLSNGNNLPQWSNPKYIQLLEEADMTSNEEKRLTLLKEAEKILIAEMPIAPIYFYKGVYLNKPYVKGIHLSELNELDLKWAYVEVSD
jgi:oligopeptide transport system substrate-binding protein